jgi:hypothetical protein
MALSTYGITNHEVEVPLSIEYSRETIHPAGGVYGSVPQYKYTRRASKTYRFKGMTAAAAQACLNAKRALYNRRFMGWGLVGVDWRPPSWFRKYYRVPPADYHVQVATFNVVRNGAAPVFDVQIAVDESVVIYGEWDFDVSTSTGCADCELCFTSSERPVSYVSSYDYDENLT